MAFDYKKEYKEFYMPKNTPAIVTVPKMNYIAVRGSGDPNVEDGDYKKAIGLLYAIAFTIKMSKKGNHKIEGYFDYVVPPLEGFWWQDGIMGVDYSRKSDFHWISVIRLPDFVTEADYRWALLEATEKKKQDFSKVEFLTIEEGLCVQCMHIGPYDDEPATVELMHAFMEQEGYELDITDKRLHHEIYLSDARKVMPEKLRTVIRHPIKVNENMQVINYFESNRQAHWLERIKRSDWSAAAFLADLISKGTFFNAVGEKSRVLLLTEGDELISFCTYAEKDDIQPTELTPWMGFVYTFPEYRGHHYIGKLFKEIERIAKEEKTPEVYISTNHIGLYEKYGCEFKTLLNDINGTPTRVYVKRIDC